MFSIATLAAATVRVQDVYERALEADIPAKLLVQVEAIGGTLEDARRLHKHALETGAAADLLAFFALQIEAGSSAPPPAALSPQP